MKLSKTLSVILSFTCFSLVYVHQQSEIFRLGYISQKRQVVFDELLDKNTVLRYNIERNSSLVHLQNNSSTTDMQMPDTYRLMKVAYLKGSPRGVRKLAKKDNFLSGLFSVKREAQAKDLNR